jgi:hypothetical protein
MIEQMGFSQKLGQVAWGGGGGPAFLGSSAGQPSDCSQQTSDVIDNEVRLRKSQEKMREARLCGSRAASLCPLLSEGGWGVTVVLCDVTMPGASAPAGITARALALMQTQLC